MMRTKLFFLLLFVSLACYSQNKTIDVSKLNTDALHALFHKADSLNAISKEAITQQDYARAFPVTKQANDIYSELRKCNDAFAAGIAELDYITNCSNLANCYFYFEDYPNAIKFNKEVVAYCRNTNNPPISCLINLHGIALSYEEINDDVNAASYYKQAYEELYKLYPIPDVNTLLAPEFCLKTAECYSRLERKDSAVFYGEKAMNIYNNMHSQGLADSIYADKVFSVAMLYSQIGDLDKAIDLAQQSLSIMEKTIGKDNDKYAFFLWMHCSDLRRSGKYDLAEKYLKELLSYYKGKGVREQVDKIERELSSLYSQKGEIKKSLDTLHDTKQKTISSENLTSTIEQLINEAYTYLDAGNIDYAITLAQDALKKSFSLDEPQYIAGSMMALIGLYENKAVNEFAINGSKKYFEDVVNFGKSCLEYITNNDVLVSTKTSIISTISTAYSILGQREEALRYADEVFALTQKAYSINSDDYLSALDLYRSIYFGLKDNANALKYALQIVDLCKDNSRIYSINYPYYLGNVASAYAGLHEYNKAIEYDVKALDACELCGGENNYSYCDLLQSYIIHLIGINDYNKAFETSLKLVSIEKNKVISLFTDINSSTRTGYWQKVRNDILNIFPLCATLSNNKSASSELYDNVALFAKGLLLETDKSLLQIIKESKDTTAINIYNNLVSYKKALDTAIKTGNELATDLQDKIFSYEETLTKRVTRLGDITHKLKTTWRDVQAALHDNDVAVEFIDFPTDDGRCYVALTLCKNDTAPVITNLFYKSQLDTLLANLGTFGILKDSHLFQLVWKPIMQRIKGKHNVYFSPSGILHDIGIEYCSELDNLNLYRLSSTREFVYQQGNAKEKDSKAVLYGNLNYDMPISDMEKKAKSYSVGKESTTRSAENLRGLRSAGPLPYTKEEVENISQILKKHGIDCTVLEGNDGTEESFIALSGNSPRILHLATHGFYWENPSEAKKSKLQFLKTIDNNYFSDEDVALNRSGLFLAGANNALRGDSLPSYIDDGILTSREIADMDLQGLDLVVLSACQTGLGDIQQGEGVFGLQRSFKKAGANTILMSLWEIDDRATQILMDNFYSNLTKGMSKQASLKAAQQYLRSKEAYTDPKYWASFILLDALN